jgi:integrase
VTRLSGNSVNLTKRLIDSFSYQGKPPRRDVRWDSQLLGLGVRVYPSDEKSFVVSYRIRGRKKLYVLGRCSHMPVKEARQRARAMLAAVDSGEDPNARQQDLRFEAFSRRFIDNYAKLHKRTWADDLGRLERHILPVWRTQCLDAISRADVAALHQKIGKKTPYEANRVLSLISCMFSQALLWGDFPEDRPNPARGIKRFREDKRDRWITPEELPRLSGALSIEPNRVAASAIEFMLLTGLRRGECLNLQWGAVSFSRKELRLGVTKAGRIHYVPLSEPALAILKCQNRSDKSPYVFPGRDPAAPINNIDKAWKRIREAADIPDVRIHDLRRTLGSWLAQQGESLHLIGRVLNHSSPQTTAIYARFSQDNVRSAIDDVGHRLQQNLYRD